ncbi:MAG: hypothetical protein Q8N59_03285 [bacterium]|nr:hypothetical protein [bacterium]
MKKFKVRIMEGKKRPLDPESGDTPVMIVELEAQSKAELGSYLMKAQLIKTSFFQDKIILSIEEIKESQPKPEESV